jgi:ribonucleoside-diphosphate reductase alpha chain
MPHSPTIPERQRLPNRRAAETFELEVGSLRYAATIGRYADGAVGEILLQNLKPGSQSDSNARDAPVAASLALQHGCPLETLQRALLRDSRGHPSTPLGAALDRILAEGGA